MPTKQEGKAMLLRDNVYRELRRAILTCEFQPGQELREQALAERYRVSRSPIRDSLLRLEQEDLVTVLPRQGYLVNPVSISDAEEIFDLRLLIEPACAAAAAARANDSALRELDRFRGFTDSDCTEHGYIEYDESFHRSIPDLSGNGRMAAVALDLIEQFERLARVSLRTFRRAHVRGLCTEHEAIIDALQAHDADRAAQLSHAHVEGTHARVIMALRLVEQQQQNSVTPPATNAANAP
jgi:GntR family transcriptional regulator, rspAB operon transcriptional repressor